LIFKFPSNLTWQKQRFTTDLRLFKQPFTLKQAVQLEDDHAHLRNQMVHEYIEDFAVLVNALQIGYSYVPNLVITANNMLAEIEQRGWIQHS